MISKAWYFCVFIFPCACYTSECIQNDPNRYCPRRVWGAIISIVMLIPDYNTIFSCSKFSQFDSSMMLCQPFKITLTLTIFVELIPIQISIHYVLDTVNKLDIPIVPLVRNIRSFGLSSWLISSSTLSILRDNRCILMNLICDIENVYLQSVINRR